MRLKGDDDIYHMLCLVLQCYRALTTMFFPRLFMVIYFRDQGLSLRKTLLHCKDYIVAVAKRMDSNKLIEILCLHYFYQLD